MLPLKPLRAIHMAGLSPFSPHARAMSPVQAFEYLCVETHTFWKAISNNTIFVTDDNATKHRDFDDEVVKTVYVQNTTSVQDFQEIVQAVRSLTEIRRTISFSAVRTSTSEASRTRPCPRLVTIVLAKSRPELPTSTSAYSKRKISG